MRTNENNASSSDNDASSSTAAPEQHLSEANGLSGSAANQRVSPPAVVELLEDDDEDNGDGSDTNAHNTSGASAGSLSASQRLPVDPTGMLTWMRDGKIAKQRALLKRCVACLLPLLPQCPASLHVVLTVRNVSPLSNYSCHYLQQEVASSCV